MDNKRLKIIKEINSPKKAVIYWMSRDQRIDYNHALIFAQKLALSKKLPLIIIFLLQKKFLNATWRQYHFMLQGLKEILEKIKKYQIDFYFIDSQSIKDSFQKLIDQVGDFDLITDFSPLKIKKYWLKEIIDLPITIYEVDAHNIVPYHQASDKKEFAAFTLRKRINLLIDKFLVEPEAIIRHPFPHYFKIENINHLLQKDINQLANVLKLDYSVSPVNWLRPGKEGALKNLNFFIKEKLPSYLKKGTNSTHLINLIYHPIFTSVKFQLWRWLYKLKKRPCPRKTKKHF